MDHPEVLLLIAMFEVKKKLGKQILDNKIVITIG
jgi:hypothetical protein